MGRGNPVVPDWRHVRIAIMAFGLAVILPGVSVAGDLGTEFPRWRCPERDGVNCLYLQLRLLGWTGPYEEVVAAVPGGPEKASLAGLATAARQLGFTLVPTKLTVAEVARLPSPTLILWEDAQIGRGRFHLLLGLSASKAYVVEGEFINRPEEMPIDRFRRGWTGFALVHRAGAGWSRRLVGITAGTLALATVWLACRVPRAWRKVTMRPDKMPPVSQEPL